MNLDLAYIKFLAEKATPGPWDVDGLGNIFRIPHAKDEDYQPIVLLSKSSLDEYAPTEANAAYIAAVNPSVILALIFEIEQLRREKDFYVHAMADYLQVAKIAWGGEIPSPLPGHTSSEEKMIEQFEYLNCPSCGGSGHVGDCSMAIQNLKCDLVNAQSKAKSLDKEADWLAYHLGKCISDSDFAFCPRDIDREPAFCDYAIPAGEDEQDIDERPCSHHMKDCWREAARNAMENNNA